MPEENRLDNILNRAVPYAPRSEDEVAARLPQQESAPVPVEGESRTDVTKDSPVTGAGEGEEALDSPRWEPVPTKERSGEIDVLRNLGDLIEEVGALMTEVTEAAEATSAASTGAAVTTDGTGTIEVAIGDDGLLSGFRLRREWRQRLPTEAFDAAALEAISNAVLQATNSHYARRWQTLPDVERPADTVTFGSGAPPAAGDPDATLRQVNLLLGEAIRDLEDLERTAARRAADEFDIKSSRTTVTLTVLDGAVTAVRTNVNWLARADAGRVCEEFESTFGALNEVIASAWRTGPDTPGEEGLGGAFSELRTMLQSMGFPMR